jgi:8-amino-7-oxononanoate synthase
MSHGATPPTNPLDWLDDEAAAWSSRGLARRLVAADAGRPGVIELDGRALINFASNDYLGLASDPRVVEAACRAARDYGWGAGASPAVAGWRRPHAALAEALADFEQVEAVALFPTGFAANAGTIAALVGRGDAVYLDRLDHACLVAGTRLAGASVRVYPHGDADRLAAILARDRGRFRRALIATDGVFSMDGDLAPLAELVALAERSGAMLLVDEAHGTGVFGADGRGAASELGVADRVPIRVGTLSKALGSLGGFVAGPRRLIDHIINHAPTFLFSTAIPPAAAAAARMALRIAMAEPLRREAVRAHGAALARNLRADGWDVGSPAGPIVPVIVGDPARALRLSNSLKDRGYLVPAIRPPTVPSGIARLRINASAAHTEGQVSGLLDAVLSASRDYSPPARSDRPDSAGRTHPSRGGPPPQGPAPGPG